MEGPRCYEPSRKEMATSSMHLTDRVPRCSSRRDAIRAWHCSPNCAPLGRMQDQQLWFQITDAQTSAILTYARGLWPRFSPYHARRPALPELRVRGGVRFPCSFERAVKLVEDADTRDTPYARDGADNGR